MHSVRRGLGVVAVGSLALTGLGTVTAVASPSATSYVVADGSSWVAQAYESTDGGADLAPRQSDVTGPQRAPFGAGSHQIVIGDSTVQTELYRTPAYDGQALSSLTRLEYSTFAKRTTGDGALRQPTYLRLNLDTNGDGTRDHSLYFFPGNNADQQPVADGMWQTWDVAGGRLSLDGDNGPGVTQSLADIEASYPDATLVNNDGDQPDGGALALLNGGAGGGNNDPETNGTYDVDRVVVGADGTDTLFDFGSKAEQTGATSKAVLDPEHLQGFVHQAYDIASGRDLTTTQAFVHGPATPPAGAGSLRFALSDDTNPNRVEQFRTPAYDGRLLRDFRTLDFSTLQRPTGGNTTPQQAPYLRLNLDTNGDGNRDHSLYFFPGNNGDLQQNAWQDWKAADGKWSVDGDAGPTGTVTLRDYVVAHPDARIVNNNGGAADGGGVAFLVGGGGDSQSNGEYFLDGVTISTVDAATGSTVSGTKFDLEPTAPVVSVANAKVVEGNNGATLVVPVTLNDVAGSDVVVHYATANGSATSGKDYVASTGTVTVPAGKKSASIPVKVISDKVRESNETLTVTISNPSYGTLGRSTATGTIVNDDTAVGLGLRQGSLHRVRVYLSTASAAANAPVKVYRVDAKRTVRVLSTHLDNRGALTTLLAQQYRPGSRVTFYATVGTQAGLYSSRNVGITVKR